MGNLKNCKVCGQPLIKIDKENRTEHYGCRCVKRAHKKGGNTCLTRFFAAVKTIDKNPDLLLKQF